MAWSPARNARTDGRGLMVRLTDAGRKAIEGAAPNHAESVQRYFFDLLSDEELETLAAVFDRVLENVRSNKRGGLMDNTQLPALRFRNGRTPRPRCTCGRRSSARRGSS